MAAVLRTTAITNRKDDGSLLKLTSFFYLHLQAESQVVEGGRAPASRASNCVRHHIHPIPSAEMTLALINFL